MEELRNRRVERVAVKVELEAFPLNGAPIPSCRVHSIAITKGKEVGSFVLFIGTDSGYLLRYLLSSPLAQDSSFNSPIQTPPHHPASAQSLPLVPPLSLPPSPAQLATSVVNSLSHGAAEQNRSTPLAPSGHDHVLISPVENFLESSKVASSPSLPSSSLKGLNRERNGMSSQAVASSSLRQTQLSHLSPNLRQSSVLPSLTTSSRENKQLHSHQAVSSSSSSSSSSSWLQGQLPASLSSSYSPAPNATPINPTPSNALDPGFRGELENGGLGHSPHTVRSFPSSRSSSPPLSASAVGGGGGKAGVEMTLTACKSVSKSPIEALCPLSECGRIAVLLDGHVALLDLQTLNILDRLSGTKGAVTMARRLDSTLPIPYRSSNMVLEELPEAKRALVTRNDSLNKLFGRAKFTSKLGGLVGGLDKAFSPGRGEGDNRRSAGPGRLGNLTGIPRSHTPRSSRTSAGMPASPSVEASGRLAVAVKKKILLFEIHSLEVDHGGQKEGLMGRTGGDSNGFAATWKMREVAGIEGVVTMAWLGDVIYAGTRHEYLLFSLTTGLPTQLFPLPDEISWQPLLKAFPQSREALLLIDNAGIPVNTEGHPSGGGLLFQILPDGIGYCPPYVLVAKQGAMEVYHHRTGAKIQTLSLADGIHSRNLVADDEDGKFIVVANSFKVYCIRQVPLDEQLRELLKHRAFKDAERLAEEGQGETGGESTKARLAMVHAQTGFLHLFDLHFEQAMDQFLVSDIMEPSELFPFFPTFTSRWRSMVPRKRYWGLHPPPQSMRLVIEDGLLSMQSGLLKSGIADGSGLEDILVGLKSGKDALVERYLRQAMENVARYLGIIREKRELKGFEREGVDTLLMKLYCELDFSSQLEELAASSNYCVLEEVESFLKEKGQLHALALLYKSKGLWNLALQVWQSLAHSPVSLPAMGVYEGKGRQHLTMPTPDQAVTEAARLLEQSPDTDLVLQHIKWIIKFDQNLAFDVLTSSKRESPLSPEDTLLALESDGGIVQQRYLLWLVEEQGLEDKFYHTELAISLARSAVRSFDKRRQVINGTRYDNQKQKDSDHIHDTNTSREASVFVDPRDFLLTFLEKSNGYDAQLVLDIIKDSKLWKEQFVLYRKLGDEISALRTLALKLEDSGAAERYCAEIGKPEAYQELMDMYLNPGEGREPMHRAAVRLLNCHGTSLDSLQVLEALSPEMPLSAAAETLAQLMVARVHRRRQGQIVRQLVRKDNLEARIARVEERSRNVSITSDSSCGSCGARIGTKLFALYPDDTIACYKCLRRFGENARPVAHRTSDISYYSAVSP